MTTDIPAQKRRLQITFWPTVMTAIMVGTSFMLGVWQSQRLIWKENLIAERVAQAAQAPLELVSTSAVPKVQDIAYRRVRVTGEFLHDKEMHFLGRDSEGRAGYMILTPLDLPGDTPWIIVNRGWVSMKERLPADRPRDPRATGTVTVTGILRPAFKKSCLNLFVATPCFTPENAPKENIWFWTDYTAMAQAVDHPIQPYVVEAERAEDPMERPKAGQTVITLPNNHLQYAITWFSLAISGFVIWFLFHWRPVSETDS